MLLPRKISVHTCNKLLHKMYVFSLQIKYCSEDCRESAWEQHHRTLCLGENQGDPSHPLEQLQEAWRLLTCLCVYEITLMKHVLDRQSGSTVICGLMHQTSNGWFQKISIPIPRAASRNSEGEGGLRRLEFRGHGGFIGLEF